MNALKKALRRTTMMYTGHVHVEEGPSGLAPCPLSSVTAKDSATEHVTAGIDTKEQGEITILLHGSPNNKLPVELWREIFTLASSIPGKEEFCTHALAGTIMACVDGDIPAALSREEQRKIVSTRFHIIQVCKFWYSIGIQLLWSHLRLDLVRGSATSGRWLPNTREKLDTDPELAAGVKILNVILPSYETKYFDPLYPSLREIIHRLPSLRIINCPVTLGISEYRCQPEIVQLQPPRSYMGSLTQNHLTAIEGFWANTRVLTVSSGREYGSPGSLLTFPALKALHIRDDSGHMIPYILQQSYMPSLRILSVYSDSWRNVEPILKRFSGQLERLELKVARHRSDRRETLQMPQLKVLFVAWSSVARLDQIEAPELQHLGCFHLSEITHDLGDRVSQALIRFPTIEHLHLQGYQTSKSIMRGIDKDLQNWRTRGIQVDIGHDWNTGKYNV